MTLDNNQLFFIELVKAGLWANVESTELCNHGFLETVDWDKVYQLAEEQSVIGVVLAGIERSNVKPLQDLLLQWIGEVQIIEQQNLALNEFVAKLNEKLRKAGIYSLLVKGQGVAQCYEKPLWRATGDVDLLLDNDNYEKAKTFLSTISSEVHKENAFDLHFSAIVKGWSLELHGSMRSMLPKKTDEEIDNIQDDAFRNRKKRIWKQNEEEISLPCADDDVIFVFTHILKHFFHYGIGLRQVCDWSRLLYTYKDELDLALLESRLNTMGLMTEWKAFGALAVAYLGMPAGAMPFYSSKESWRRKARRILAFIMETGNFGHNRDTSYYNKYPRIVREIISLGRHTGDSIRHFFIFPLDAIRIWGRMVSCGISDALKRI